ncbi:hypothetical protein ROLI_045280 (plasmid) [Roseobacter fucihabitans]|uniref:Uncharacterized protein n=1 Tax=Roseobacter fucihabitans TaxID=1537242 RepID=A0ABZ2C089_9RHOB|nr:hypothetical protein [Roseobacter litoralis]MBC6967243.1 hypothetical protein [Roseobacter litoralis]
MIRKTLILPLVRKGLSGKGEGRTNPARPLSVRFEDGALTITPQRPSVPARFTVAFGDGALTIIP